MHGLVATRYTAYVNFLILDNYTVIFTGVIGCGKSRAGNFFLNKEAFESSWSLKPVTVANASATGIIKGKHITIIDTPGFLDPSFLDTKKEFLELAQAIVDMPKGVNAVGLLINIEDRVKRDDANLLKKLLTMEKMLPYVFLCFTHAKVLGENETQQRQKIEGTLKDKNNCPESLFNVLNEIDNRYILLESVAIMGEGYYEKKSQELLDILQAIMNKNVNVYSCAVNEIAENLRKLDVDEQKLVEHLAADLQTVKANSEPDMFWRNLILYIGGGIGIGLGAAAVGAGVGAGVMFSSAIAAAGSRIFAYLSSNPEIAKRFVVGIIDIAKKRFGG